MAQPQPYGYYYGSEAEQYTFYRLPKALFTNSRFKCLSDGAKILYGLMLDRMGLSVKNGWLDEQDRVYIYFTLEDVTEQMNCKNDKGVKLLAELDTAKGVGLIERVKQGQGRPTIIYVRRFFDAAEVLTSEKPKSALPDLPKSALRQNRSLDYGKTDPNKTESNKTDINQTDYPSIHPAEQGPVTDEMDRIERYRELVMENIEYAIMCQRHDKERVDEVVELMLETVLSKREYIHIAGDEYPREVVKSRLLKLDSSHVQYVFDCIDKNTTKVHNIKAYLLTALYNAPATIDSYYRAEVNHDLYGGT